VTGVRALCVDDDLRATRKIGRSGPGVRAYPACASTTVARTGATTRTGTTLSGITSAGTSARSDATSGTGNTTGRGTSAGRRSTARRGTTGAGAAARTGITATPRIAACRGSAARTVVRRANAGVIANRASLQRSEQDAERKNVSPRCGRHSFDHRFLRPPETAVPRGSKR
jgi:hypothetical protein